MKQITTRDLELVPVHPKYVNAVYKIIKEENKELSSWTTIPFPITKKKIREYYQEGKRNDDSIFIIKSKTGEVMGSINFLHRKRSKSGAIGYWLGRDYRNKGYMTEAVKKMIEYGFRRKSVVRIDITALEQNIPSQTVIKKCGFIYEGTQRMAALNGLNQYGNLRMYSILKDEFEKQEEIYKSRMVPI